jgi:hypothetical protein
VLPFHLPLWETDATFRAALQESVQVGLAPLAPGAILSGGEISGDARAVGPRSVFTAEARARFARALDLGGGPAAPEDDVDAEAAASATWTPTPLSSLSLTTQGSLATSWGIRADSLLLNPDPFEDAPRLAYGLGADLASTWTITPRGELAVDAGFAQEGALASEVPSVVGLDSREIHGGVSYGIDVAPRLSLTPEVRYAFTHCARALLAAGHRGLADVHAVTVSLGASREVVPRLFLTAGGGVTAASPMPAVSTIIPVWGIPGIRWSEMLAHRGSAPSVVAPEATLGLRWRGRRSEITARYAWAYGSLGPRIGYGQQHTATVRLTAWPFTGARDVVLKGVLRARHGSAALDDDPLRSLLFQRPPASSVLVTSTLAGRATLEIPVTRGWAVTAGIDLTFARGFLSPARPQDEPHRMLTGLLTLGLATTVSTDKHRLYPRDPGADEDDATRRAGVRFDERTEDRTRIDEGRAEEP